MKVNQIQKFIEKGSKVKITIQMRGRENSKAKDVLEQFSSQFSEYLSGFKYDAPLKLSGNRIIGVIVKDEK
jgi:translation initiation factor IF-3